MHANGVPGSIFDSPSTSHLPSESPVRIVSSQLRMAFVMIVDVVHIRNRVEVAYNVGCTEGLTCLYWLAVDL